MSECNTVVRLKQVKIRSCAPLIQWGFGDRGNLFTTLFAGTARLVSDGSCLSSFFLTKRLYSAFGRGSKLNLQWQNLFQDWKRWSLWSLGSSYLVSVEGKLRPGEECWWNMSIPLTSMTPLDVPCNSACSTNLTCAFSSHGNTRWGQWNSFKQKFNTGTLSTPSFWWFGINRIAEKNSRIQFK